MNIAFFGTHEFSVAIFERLLSDFYRPVVAITQPNRPVGRKQISTPPPILDIANYHAVPVLQPNKPIEILSELQALNLDLIIVAAYGNIIPQAILDLPKFGALNIHTSLLPKYRGASPIQQAILNGDQKTGITIMKMDALLDHGDIIYQYPIDIDKKDTFATLQAKLATKSADILTKILPDYLAGKIKPQPQDHDLATLAPIITTQQAQIDWYKSASMIEQQIRAFTPWPIAWTVLPSGKRAKIFKVHIADFLKQSYQAGEIIIANKKLYIATNDLLLEILEIQVEGKNKISGADFALGYQDLTHKLCQ